MVIRAIPGSASEAKVTLSSSKPFPLKMPMMREKVFKLCFTSTVSVCLYFWFKFDTSILIVYSPRQILPFHLMLHRWEPSDSSFLLPPSANPSGQVCRCFPSLFSERHTFLPVCLLLSQRLHNYQPA